ncbi:MAG: ABC transporter permease [Caldilineaceae bacterium]
MAFYLAVKEILHNKGRFLLIAMIVALITTLVLFIAALAEGLGSGNREYIENLNGELIVYQENVDLNIGASRVGRSTIAQIRRVPGVEAVGQVGTSVATILLPDDPLGLDVSLIGVEAGLPGEPPTVEGVGLSRSRGNEVIIDANVAERSSIRVGDEIVIKTTQGTEEETTTLVVVGQSEGQAYSLQPSIFLPYLTWERVRPQAGDQTGELVSNVAVVRVAPNDEPAAVALQIAAEVDRVEVVDLVTAYQNTPGYSAQQSTLNTQRYFTFFIGILVIGGFFQIQTLQKVAQIGMLKAIGASNRTVGLAAILQIVTINTLGVAIGAVGTVALVASFPAGIPIVLTGSAVAVAVLALLVIGPMGGIVSVFALVRIEPLRALGLAQ